MSTTMTTSTASKSSPLKIADLNSGDLVVVGVLGGIERTVMVKGITMEGRGPHSNEFHVQKVYIRECGAPPRSVAAVGCMEKILRRASDEEERGFKERDQKVRKS